jgi:hypothetical protein
VLNGEALNELNKSAEVVAKTINDAVKGLSKGIAESIVLGKSLGDAFKNVLNKILIDILATQIEIIIREGINLTLKKLQTAEIVKQNALLAQQQALGGGGGSGFFGSLLKIGSSFFGGGTSPFDTGGEAIYTNYAEGGSVKGGVPVTVGERGRELFIPSSNGTIVPNQDLGSGTNITFNIQANDVRGIRELLIDNRATIINLVNQGANAKGRSNVV